MTSGNHISRRIFLAAVTAGLAVPAAAGRGAAAQDDLHILKNADLERLRMDFNGNRARVRLLMVLSPT